MELADDDPIAANLAFLVAGDRGYELAAVVAAVDEGTFDLDGFVVDESGAIVQPVGEDLGLISDKTPLAVEEESSAQPEIVLVGLPPEGVTMAELGTDLENDVEGADIGSGSDAGSAADGELSSLGKQEVRIFRGGLLLRRVALLRDAGFSMEQIIESIVFDISPSCTESQSETTREYYTTCTLDGEDPDFDSGSLFRSGAPAESPPETAATAEPSAEQGTEFEAARYVGVAAFENDSGGLFGELGEGGGSEGPPDEILIDSIEFVAGDELTGGVEVLANVNVLGDLDCLYLSFEFANAPLTGDGTQTYAGDGTGSLAFEDETCGGTTPPASLQSGPVSISAEVVGDVLTATISGDGGDEPMVLTATRVDS